MVNKILSRDMHNVHFYIRCVIDANISKNGIHSFCNGCNYKRLLQA